LHRTPFHTDGSVASFWWWIGGSTLDDRTFSAPVGMSGVWPVKFAAERPFANSDIPARKLFEIENGKSATGPVRILMLFRATSLAYIYWADGLGPPKTKRDLGMAERTFDARRMARDQESRMAAAAVVGLHAIKYQASFLRMWADNAELFARNYERSLETFSSVVEDQ
jgi:hypothetical protein